MWIKLVKKKYYWLTTEERVEANKKCFGSIAELGKKMFPDGFPKYEQDYYEDNDITDEEMEVLLQYRKDKVEGKIGTVLLSDLRK